MSSFGLYDQNQTENNKKKSQASVKKTIKQQIYNKALLNKLNLVSRSSSIWWSSSSDTPLARVPAKASLVICSHFLWNSCSGYSSSS
jgi:hypothetical protein